MTPHLNMTVMLQIGSNPNNYLILKEWALRFKI